MADQPQQAHYHKLNERNFNQRTAKEHARHLLPYIKPHHWILDLGCGPGAITADLAELVPKGEVVGIDVDETFIEAGKALAEKRGLKNVTFRPGDVKTDLTTIPPSSFDIIHAHQLLLHLPSPVTVVLEAHRILKPCGIFSTVDSALRTIIPAIPGAIASNETYERFTRSRGADPNFGLTHHIVAHEAGFAWEDMEMSSWTMREMGEEGKKRIAEGAGPAAEGFMERGLISAEEAEAQREGGVEWAGLRESRWLEVASGLVCWKR
ncbi:hypothetical protein M409DRAFT_22303 [Zasmidium cellare ATCC 36951]|uniref:Methyltransferase domain-containing protein n=1 Tax=Zasmidium cellare ATCC 36951 TaxID=1080233 RepID=A0A6A6CJU3_ZASCE|nr:uncharacterized protein M409DRAFT_22303 [Zasmidium cellare ATCC 36951]KAF2167494.1 hypothetical protein M409DRAFT_22303 [Zasmidium cellare ATCC 36951]